MPPFLPRAPSPSQHSLVRPFARAAPLTSRARSTCLAGKCLDIDASDATNGTPIVLWTCDGSNSQRWRACSSEGEFR